MKNFFSIAILLLFLANTPLAYGSTLLHWFVKHEIKAEMQDIADKFVDKDVQKVVKKEYKEYKKYKKQEEKMREKKLKRIEKEKKRQAKEKFNEQVEKAKSLEEEEKFEFQKYNDPQGSPELDFFGIYGKRQINTEGVVSPDFSKMIYSEVHFYPSVCQLTTELFLLPLPDAKTPVERVIASKTCDKKPLNFYAPGMDKVEAQFFRTMTMIDWSNDGTKILAKERIAENLKCFLQTRVWVYDLGTQKSYYLEKIRAEIENYWKQDGLDLRKYKWDITPMGWYEPNSNRQSDEIIVHAYGYEPDKTKVFLGAWLVNYKTGEMTFIKKTKRYKASQNGMVLRPKLNKL